MKSTARLPVSNGWHQGTPRGYRLSSRRPEYGRVVRAERIVAEFARARRDGDARAADGPGAVAVHHDADVRARPPLVGVETILGGRPRALALRDQLLEQAPSRRLDDRVAERRGGQHEGSREDNRFDRQGPSIRVQDDGRHSLDERQTKQIELRRIESGRHVERLGQRRATEQSRNDESTTSEWRAAG